MTHVDFLILGIVAISMAVGYFRGFFPEVIAVGTWVLAALGAIQFSGLVEPYVAGKMGSTTVELWTARAVVFVAVMIVGGLVGQLVSLVVDKAGLSGTDKTLGLAFGLVRGGLVVGVLVIIAQLIGLSRDDWWQESKLVPYGEAVASGIRNLLPADVLDAIEPVIGGVELAAPTDEASEAPEAVPGQGDDDDGG